VLLLLILVLLMHAEHSKTAVIQLLYFVVSFGFLQVMSQSLPTLKKQKLCGSR
jgi:hypothetical protein